VLAEWSVAGGVEVGELVVDIDGDGTDQSDAVGLGRGQGDALRTGRSVTEDTPVGHLTASNAVPGCAQVVRQDVPASFL
jgi:hypothetical protein